MEVDGPRKKKVNLPQSPFPMGSEAYTLLEELWAAIEGGTFQSQEEVALYAAARYAVAPTAQRYSPGSVERFNQWLDEQYDFPDTAEEAVVGEEGDDDGPWMFAKAVSSGSGLPSLVEEVNRINQRASDKMGVDKAGLLHLRVEPEPVVRVHPVWYQIDPMGMRAAPDRYRIKVFEFEILGDPLKVAGWKLVGVISYLEDKTSVVTRAPGYEGEIPERFWDSSPNLCEHCQTKRKRKECFILYSEEENRFMQVGRSCLKDFLGVSGDTLAQRLDYIRKLYDKLGGGGGEVDEESFWGGGAAQRADVLELVLWGTSVYRKLGWVTATQARERGWSGGSADDAVEFAQGPPRVKELIKKYEEAQPDGTDLEEAEKALEWILDLDVSPQNDYLFTLQQLARQEVVPARMEKRIAGLYAAYARAMERDRERQRDQHAESEYVGEIGEYGTFPNVTLEAKRPFDGMYGPTFQHKFVDEDGNVFIWWASRDSGFEPGAKVDVVATIKDHKAFRGEKQTVITRAVLHEAGQAPQKGRTELGYVGEEGERSLFANLTYEDVFTVDTAYGDLDIMKFRDPDGNLLVWKTSSAVWKPGADRVLLDIGDTVDMVATVKEHSEYRGEKQTVVTRASVYEAGKGKAPKKKKTTGGVGWDDYAEEELGENRGSIPFLPVAVRNVPVEEVRELLDGSFFDEGHAGWDLPGHLQEDLLDRHWVEGEVPIEALVPADKFDELLEWLEAEEEEWGGFESCDNPVVVGPEWAMPWATVATPGYVIIDGWHRVASAVRRGQNQIRAIVGSADPATEENMG